MSDEPRLRLERNGVVVSEYGYDQSTGETVVESESGETYRFANDGTLDTPALNTDQASITSVGKGNVQPSPYISFSCELLDEPFANRDDPILIHKKHFDDNEYRLGFKEVSSGDYELYRTPDFENFTQISSNINGSQFQDHVVLDDGTFVLYDTNGNSGTDVWTGTDLTNLTNQGTVISGEDDAGVFREGDTIHIYTEDADNAKGAGSHKLSHYTTSTTDLTTATQQSDAIDVTNRDWKTGDPDIIEHGRSYYMFFDNTENHPEYNIALARSDDLYNWDIVQEEITSTFGGDMVVVANGDHYTALTEFTGSDLSGVGLWRLYPIPMLAETGVQGLYARNMEAEEGQFTEETYIRAKLSTDITGNSAGAWVNPADGERFDKRNEFNGSQQFVPERTGRYVIEANITVKPGTDQDICAARIRNVTDGTNAGIDDLGRFCASGTKWQSVTFAETQFLTGGDAYEVQVTDENSTFDVGAFGSVFTIKWCPIQPDNRTP